MMVTAVHCYTCAKDTILYIKTANLAILKTLLYINIMHIIKHI